MCGHFGIMVSSQAGLTSSEVEAIEILCYIDTLRGNDATGLTVITNSGDVHLNKAAISGAYFCTLPEPKAALDIAYKKGVAVLGHNRKATVGGFKDEASHPFVIDNKYVFNHNGKLDAHKKWFDTEVDSEALGKIICPQNGDKAKLEAVLSELSVAMAVVWYDMEEHAVYMLRNSQRPLWTMQNQMGTVVYYASERWMLEAVKANCNLTAYKDPVEIPTNTLYKYQLGKSAAEKILESETKLEIVKKALPSYTGGKHQQTHTTKQKNTKRGGKNMQSTGTTGIDGGSTAGFLSSAGAYNGFEGMPNDIELPPWDDGGISRNEYKRTAKKLVNNVVTVWVDDVLPNGKESGNYLVWATHDELYPGFVFEYIATGLSMEEADNIEGRLMTGTIQMCQYEKESRRGIAYFKGEVKFNKASINRPETTLH